MATNLDSFAESPLGEFIESPLGARGLEVSIVWHIDAAGDELSELDPVDLSIVRTTTILTPATLSGCGGTTTRLWISGSGDNVELAPLDFTVIQTVTAPDTDTQSIDGDSISVWQYGLTGPTNFELDPDSLATVQSAAPPAGGTGGTGGTGAIVWHSDDFAGTMFELDPDDLTVVKSGLVTTGGEIGCGGSTRNVYLQDVFGDAFILEPADFSVRFTALVGGQECVGGI